MGVTNSSDEISYGSNYSKHYTGGILRNVKPIALPANHITRFELQTAFDSADRDATLEVAARTAPHEPRKATLRFRLEDPENHPMNLPPHLKGIAVDES